MKRLTPLPPSWQARLVALPGMLTLLSVLAVLLGAHPPAHDAPPPRAPALATLPSLPEWQAAPLSPVPLPQPSTPPSEMWVPRAGLRLSALRPPLWRAPAPRTDLTWWGRRQTDGG